MEVKMAAGAFRRAGKYGSFKWNVWHIWWYLLSFNAGAALKFCVGLTNTHLCLSCPTNNWRPMRAMTQRKKRNSTSTSLNIFSDRRREFTIARRPNKGKKWYICTSVDYIKSSSIACVRFHPNPTLETLAFRKRSQLLRPWLHYTNPVPIWFVVELEVVQFNYTLWNIQKPLNYMNEGFNLRNSQSIIK